MSSVVAARENMSAGEWGFGGWESGWVEEWEEGGGLVKDGVRDWADLEWRREEGGFVVWDGGKRVLEGDVRVDVFEEEEVEVEIIDGAEGVFFVLRDQKDEMRCFFCCGDVAVASVWVEEAAEEAEEEEEDEKVKEKRDGEFGRPMRMTVPFEAAEFGLA